MTQDITVTQQPTPMDLIGQMISAGIDKDTLKEAFAMQRQWTQDRAAEAFADALTGFKSECPQIEKSERAGKPGDNFTFMYAALETIDTKIRPLLTKYKIVDTYDTEFPGEGLMKTICRIRVGIHVENTSVTLAIPKGVANSTQLMIQAISYGKRVALCAGLGIVTKGEDKDGHGLNDYIVPDQIGELNTLIEQIEKAGGEVNTAAFLKFALERDKLENDDHMGLIHARRFEAVKAMLASKLVKVKKGGAR